MRDRHGLTMVALKSSFLAKEPERRISRGYCRDIGSRTSLSIYILGRLTNAKDWKGYHSSRVMFQEVPLAQICIIVTSNKEKS